MVKTLGVNQLAGIIAPSVGGATVINCLSKENTVSKTVLIAPALKLKELLFITFHVDNDLAKFTAAASQAPRR